MSAPEPVSSASPALSELFGLSGAAHPTWRFEDFAPILRHQLGTPLEAELGRASGVKADDAAQFPLRDGPVTFEDLFSHPHPPLGLLRLAKDFAKTQRTRAESCLPAEVATVLYFASIAAALVRCGERISDLTDEKLRAGVEWCRGQSWVDEALKNLLSEAGTLLSRCPSRNL